MNEYENLVSIKDLKDEFMDYDQGYICDVISEIADSNVDIYNYDLLKSAWDLYSSGAYDDAMSEQGSSNNIIKDFQMAQYYYYSGLLYEYLEDIIIEYIEIKADELTNNVDVLDYVLENIKEYDNNDRLEDIIEDIKDLINDFESEDE